MNPKSKLQNRKLAGVVTVLGTLGMCGARVEAQQPGKIPRIGILSPGPAANPSSPDRRMEALRQALLAHGYTEGKNILIEYRYADGKLGRVPNLAAEMVRLNVDVIVAMGAATLPTVKTVTGVPVVITYSGDPVQAGIVASLARPGRNVTGITFYSAEIAGKRLELFKEAAPGISRLAVLSNPRHAGEKREWRETQLAAQALAMTVQYLTVQVSNDFDEAFRAMSKKGADSVVVFSDAVTSAHRNQIAEFALKSRIPSVFGWDDFVEAGGLMSYGADRTEPYRRVATQIDKILKGINPVDLPIETPKKFDFVVNIKTAKQIGISIPPNVLARADKVIK